MAEGGRFELPVACATTDFESVTFGLSDTPPGDVTGCWSLGAGKSLTLRLQRIHCYIELFKFFPAKFVVNSILGIKDYKP